ncbi:MAG: hypothetical protein PVJ84_14095 [Desulfobacteraceae bacterium]|jgi:hypothetical protein
MQLPSERAYRTGLQSRKITSQSSETNTSPSTRYIGGHPLATGSDTPILSRRGIEHIRWAIIACLLFILFPSILPAAQVQLAWDDPNSPAANCYRVYQRIDGDGYDYNAPAWASDTNGSNGTTCTIDGLTEEVTYFFVVRACDGLVESGDSNEVQYRALSNRSPVAMIGGTHTVTAGSLVILNGADSYDQDGDALTYDFQQTSGPIVDLNCSGAQCTFTAPGVTGSTTALTFDLTVGDEKGLYHTATTTVLVEPATSQGEGGGVDDPVADDGNNGPELPVLTTPANGESNVELMPRLGTSAFSDPDGDDHLLTQWQITETTSGIVVMDLVSMSRYLTEMRVPQLVLNASTQYSARVRFFDHLGKSSQWSEPTTFTIGEDSGDLNNNQIPDNLEVSEHTDMNNDAIADIDQPTHIKSVSIADGQYLVGISVTQNSNGIGIDAISSVDPKGLDIAPGPEVQLPFGLLNYKIRVPQPGDRVDVTIYLSDPLDTQLASWMRYDSLKGWQNSSANTVMDTQGFVVERSLQDGGEEDADGVANGFIIDLSGPSYRNSNESSLTGPGLGNDPAASGGGGGGCFVGSIFGAD